jgi:Domain of unknown function (DUF6458)
MGIGASVFMLAIGAIIAFAFNVRVGWLDLDVVGWVLMAAGAFGLVLSLIMLNRGRRTITRTATTNDPYAAPPAERVVEQRSTYDVDRPL